MQPMMLKMKQDEVLVDALAQWLRHAHPQTVMAEATEHLARGVDEDALWVANARIACRYVNNQAHNLLGFVSHAMIGSEDARQLIAHQPRENGTGDSNHITRRLLLLHSLYQTVADLHDPCFAPWELLPFWPIHESTSQENIFELRRDVRLGEYSRADHRFVGLAETLSQADLVNLVLEVGLEGMVTDDHTLISPVLSLDLIRDLVGWGEGLDMLRCAIRYSASFPIDFAPFDRSVGYVERYALGGGGSGNGLQKDRIQPLRQAFFEAQPALRPEIAVRALAEEGCSPHTIIAAAAEAACDMYLRVDPVPHQDYDAISREVAPIHIGNCLRLLYGGLAYMQPRTQALAALQAGSLLERGPSILSPDFRFVAFEPARAYPYAEDVADLERYDVEALLVVLEEALFAHDCRTATAAVQAYAQAGGVPEVLIGFLTRIACTDNGTLMHNFKHLNSMVLEFQRCAHPDRWNYLIQAAKFMSWYCGLTTGAYTQAAAALGMDAEAMPFTEPSTI